MVRLDNGTRDPAGPGHVEAHQAVCSIALAQHRDGLELLFRPIEHAANLWEHAQQVAACLRLPRAVALWLGLQVHDRVRVRPRANDAIL
eukprot:15446432-Alexandrium_andersonii.AAC.1